MPQKSRERLRFFTRQYINAMAPSNFLATNPELLKLTLESDGQNLVRGLALLAEDLERSADQLNIRLTDESAFELGDLALTPGRVVQRTELYELIQYSPTTETVARTPVLIVPPFINKYYILDMRPQNSLVAWLVAQGQTVFMISWRNPGPAQADIDLDDYVVDGVIAALDGVEAATGEREVHGIGYCIGGTALSLAMGWLAARRQKQRVRSATLFTTLLDFSQPGNLASSSTNPSLRRWKPRTKPRASWTGASWRSPSACCGKTASTGITTSTATSRGRARWRSICCTGTATAPTWQARPTAACCAGSIWRTSW